MRQTGPWETDWIVISSEEATGLPVISSEEATGLAGFVYFRSCFENVHTRRIRDMVQANSRAIPRVEKAIWNTKAMSKY